MLLHLFASFAWPIDAAGQGKESVNGSLSNGHVKGHSVDRRVRDAEEFELEGLMSEDENGDDATPPSQQTRKSDIREA